MARLVEVGSNALFSPEGLVSRAFVSLHNMAAGGNTAPLPSTFRPLCEKLGVKPLGYTHHKPSPLVPLRALNHKKAVVAFSGGRDGVATALILHHVYGYEVVLFHVAGLNVASAHKEVKAAQTLAGMLGLPLEIEWVSYKGQSTQAENPTKNCLVLAMMVGRTLDSESALVGKSGYPGVFALGTMETDRGLNSSVGVSDNIEVLELTMQVINTVVPDVELRTVLKSNTDSFLTVFSTRPDLIPHVRSCLLSEHLKTAHRQRVARSYEIQIMAGRCGVCYKCCGEWLFLRAVRSVEPNDGYQRYCVDRLAAAMPTWGRYSVTRKEAVDFFLDAEALPAVKEFT